MPGKRVRVFLRRCHRWMGVVIGVQLALWVITGAYFAWLSIDTIRGNDNNRKADLPPLQVQGLVAAASLPLEPGLEIKSINLDATLRGPIYTAMTADDRAFRFDAVTGQLLGVLDPKDLPAYIAEQKEGVEVDSALLLQNKVREFGGQYPVYRVALKDGMHGTLYVDPWTGKVLATRNRLWVIYDFLWMLHIMDYKEREDFNNALIRALSLLAIGVIASGYFLFFVGKMPRRD